MQLLNSLFKIVHETQSEENHSCRIVFNSKHIIYKGHFPGFPLTPGVIQIQILEELVERKLGETCTLISVQQSKFLKVINPKKTEQVSVIFAFVKEELGIKVIGKFEQNNAIYFKFSGVFKSDPV